MCCLYYAYKHMETEEQYREPAEGDWPSGDSLEDTCDCSVVIDPSLVKLGYYSS